MGNSLYGSDVAAEIQIEEFELKRLASGNGGVDEPHGRIRIG